MLYDETECEGKTTARFLEVIGMKPEWAYKGLGESMTFAECDEPFELELVLLERLFRLSTASLQLRDNRMRLECTIKWLLDCIFTQTKNVYRLLVLHQSTIFLPRLHFFFVFDSEPHY